MSWLRLHAAGKRVIGLTTAPRTQTDFRLGRPFDGHLVATLLRTIAEESGVDVSVPAAADAGSEAPAPSTPAAASAPLPTPVAPPAAVALPPQAKASPVPLPPAVPSGPTPAPAPQDQLPEEVVQARDEEAAPPPPPEAPPLPPRDPVFVDWLAPGALHGRFRYRREGGAHLLIDATTRQYHGPAALKSVATYFEGVVRSADFEPVDDATWAAESIAAGAAQPLQRLQWFGGLLTGKGELLPGYDAAGRYKLTKWPQTEREFPKHFRIATAMMKGPATLPEIAGASGIPVTDVADFINANLITGFAELEPELPPEPTEPAKPTGLLGRLRGR